MFDTQNPKRCNELSSPRLNNVHQDKDFHGLWSNSSRYGEQINQNYTSCYKLIFIVISMVWLAICTRPSEYTNAEEESVVLIAVRYLNSFIIIIIIAYIHLKLIVVLFLPKFFKLRFHFKISIQNLTTVN